MRLISICMICMAFQLLHAQDTLREKHLIFNISVVDMQNNKHKGFLATINDSVLFLTTSIHALTFEPVNLISPQKINYRDINKVMVIRKGSVGRGMVIGGISGLVVGAIIGYSRHVDPNFLSGVSQGGNALVGSLVGGAAGCLVGAAIGALSRKVFTIGGRKEKLNKMREIMTARLYDYQ